MPKRKSIKSTADPIAATEKQLDAQGIEFVRFEQSDTHGIARSKTVPTRHFASFARRGLNFLLGQLAFDAQAGVAMGSGYLESLGFPDSHILPDLSTLQVLPWADQTARVLCEPHFLDGRPAMAAPRLVVKKMLGELAELGYEVLSGFEYEFYVVDAKTKQAPFPGIQIFATLRNSFDEALVYEILRGMSAVGVDIITSNAEYGPGQMEINFAPARGVQAADDAFTFKNGVKEIAQRRGRMASFMTKPWIDQSANGCHYHLSLWRGNQNAFLDANSADGLTQVAKQFIAGIVAHASALSAFAAPTVNCAKRYKLWSFAPANASWGFENRSVAVRVKSTRDERTHIENRLGGGSSNPYLLMAATLAAGMDGIKNNLSAPPAVDGVAYGMEGLPALPARLESALAALDADTALRDALGAEFIQVFTAVKRHEIAKAQAAIPEFESSDFVNNVYEWERDEYFEFL
ncbi:MAG: glutamine synthetase [Chloroflexi bacterium]|nr:glutamine synthetase [Chloroflexota bacterium]